MVKDGRFLQSDFTFRQDGKTSTGTGISGFDPQNGHFTTFWFDSRSTKFSIRQSRELSTANRLFSTARRSEGNRQDPRAPSPIRKTAAAS
jgi:hypothetical protein